MIISGPIIGLGTLAGTSLLALAVAMKYRKVVPTNTVDIVQSAKKTTSFGTGKSSNVYYAWPSAIPKFGVTVIGLPVSNFDLSLKDYEAYDVDKVPFMVDVTAFFRIANTDIAAQRVMSVQELKQQLTEIVRGAVRKVLANDTIDKIMLDRAKFGNEFTEEVTEQLKEWGVEPVKSMELMDIRDVGEGGPIDNIMAMKTSNIEMTSRKEVADNRRAAEVAEIEAQQNVDVRAQEAQRIVGEQTAEKTKLIGIAEELAQQDIAVERKTTREKELDVQKVDEVKTAEINKEKMVVAAKEDAETRVVKAEGQKQEDVLLAEGQLEAEKRRAQGIEAVGLAEGAAVEALRMADVTPELNLAEGIGSNVGYQDYLVKVATVKANETIGVEQAKALVDADVKIIANAGSGAEGLATASKFISSAGGTDMAGMLESLAQSDLGSGLLSKLGVNATTPAPKAAVKATPKPRKPRAPKAAVKATPKPRKPRAPKAPTTK